MQGPELPFLSNWQNYYMIIGTAAATLIGLMLVVTTLSAGIETHVSTLNGVRSLRSTHGAERSRRDTRLSIDRRSSAI